MYSSLHSDCRRLAMMGSRALIDTLIKHGVGNCNGFASGLQRLQEDGFLSQRDRDVLQAALEAGHAATHRGHLPDVKEIHQVMDIVENVL